MLDPASQADIDVRVLFETEPYEEAEADYTVQESDFEIPVHEAEALVNSLQRLRMHNKRRQLQQHGKTVAKSLWGKLKTHSDTGMLFMAGDQALSTQSNLVLRDPAETPSVISRWTVEERALAEHQGISEALESALSVPSDDMSTQLRATVETLLTKQLGAFRASKLQPAVPSPKRSSREKTWLVASKSRVAPTATIPTALAAVREGLGRWSALTAGNTMLHRRRKVAFPQPQDPIAKTPAQIEAEQAAARRGKSEAEVLQELAAELQLSALNDDSIVHTTAGANYRSRNAMQADADVSSAMQAAALSPLAAKLLVSLGQSSFSKPATATSLRAIKQTVSENSRLISTADSDAAVADMQAWMEDKLTSAPIYERDAEHSSTPIDDSEDEEIVDAPQGRSSRRGLVLLPSLHATRYAMAGNFNSSDVIPAHEPNSPPRWSVVETHDDLRSPVKLAGQTGFSEPSSRFSTLYSTIKQRNRDPNISLPQYTFKPAAEVALPADSVVARLQCTFNDVAERRNLHTTHIGSHQTIISTTSSLKFTQSKSALQSLRQLSAAVQRRQQSRAAQAHHHASEHKIEDVQSEQENKPVWSARLKSATSQFGVVQADNLSKITHISFADANLSDDDAAKVVAHLAVFPELRVLDFAHNRVGTKCLHTISDTFWGQSSRLLKLDLQRNKMSDGLFGDLASAAERFSNVVNLNLSHNKVRSNVFQYHMQLTSIQAVVD